MRYLNRVLLYSLMFFSVLTLSVNAQKAEHHKKSAALDGYCPVAYHVLNKAVKGKQKYSSTYNKKTYDFVNAKAKKMFDKDPVKFLPKYDGYCATAMSMGKKLKSNPKLFTIYKMNTYLFSTKKAKMMFDKDPAMFVAKANKEFIILNKKH